MKNRIFLLSALAASLPLPTLANGFWKSDLNENLTNVAKSIGHEGFHQDTEGKPWPGIGPNGEAAGSLTLPYARIPAMTITDDNKMVVMFDLRWGGSTDHGRIDPGVAISEDGGHTWEKRTAWNFNESKLPLRRAMDPTILHNSIDGSLYVMHGTWSTGSQNWYRDRIAYYRDNVWATTIYKSTDGGYTWNKNAEFSKNINNEVFAKVQKGAGNQTVAFLGGVGSGIVMKDGTLVFPIQTAHLNGIATTIMYSKDNGKTWDMPETTTPVAPNQISLENMVFEIGSKLVMTGREDRLGRNQAKGRWAYYTEDLGKTWNLYEPVNEFSSSTAQPTQGSSIYVTLPNGRRVLLVSKPNGNNDNWARGNLALWMLDAKNPEHKHQVTIIRPGSGNPKGAGYSSLAYKEGNLFVAFEDDGDITVKNLTEYLSTIENKALEWGLPDEISDEIERIQALEYLNKGQKDELIAKMRKANDYAVSQSFVLNQEMKELKVVIENLSLQSKAKTTAMPSKIRAFNEYLDEVSNLTGNESPQFIDYFGIANLENMLNSYFLALDTKLDFSNYVNQAKKLNSYNNDILYSSYDKIFIEYDSMLKNKKYNPSVALGLNTDISENSAVGVFFEQRSKEGKTKTVGLRAKYDNNNNTLSSFVRYRSVKHEDIAGKNNNVDLYLNYARQFAVDNQLTVSPFVGVSGSFSSRTLLDEDVAMNKRFVFGGDVGINIGYQLSGVKVDIRPSVALLNDSSTLSQANYEQNQYKIKSSNLVYGLTTSIEKKFKSVSVGSKIKLQKYGSQSSDVNIGVNLSYNW